MKEIKPYYRRKNKLFFRKGKKRMVVERTDVGVYNFSGQPLYNTKIEISFGGEATIYPTISKPY